MNVYLQRDRYQRQGEFRGYRNGTTPRRLTLGSGTVPLEVPQVRDIPPGQEPFESKIVRKYQRRSDTIEETFMRLFIEGLATRDFEPALRLLAGNDAPLSPSTISRLTQRFRVEYAAFDRQDPRRPEVRLYLGGRDLPEGRAGYGESLPDGADRGGYGGAEALARAAGGVSRERPRAGASC
ncbi:MAG: transposase [Phycisphaerales bacterium]|nr:transposase [Phycisphaerales bacterium]